MLPLFPGEDKSLRPLSPQMDIMCSAASNLNISLKFLEIYGCVITNYAKKEEKTKVSAKLHVHYWRGHELITCMRPLKLDSTNAWIRKSPLLLSIILARFSYFGTTWMPL